MQFLRQSWRSSYCGVYSAAMFLSILGRPTGREAAFSLFGLARTNKSYPGTERREISAVLKKSNLIRSASWALYRRLSCNAVASTIARSTCSPSPPGILWFGIIHPRDSTRVSHYAVVVKAESNQLKLLDPLGPPPAHGRNFNVSITESLAAKDRAPDTAPPYVVNWHNEASLMLCLR